MVEQRLNPSEVARKLVLSYSARQDFLRATEIADVVTPDSSQMYTYIHLGREQATVGLDYSTTLTRLHALAARPGQIYQDIIYKGVADVHVASGNLEAAGEALELAPHKPSERRYYLDLAVTKSRFNQDPIPELTKVEAEIQEYETKYPSSGIESYAELAEAHFRATGQYPETYLAKAEANIQAHERQYPSEIHLAGWYGDIAKAYATCGNFEKALGLVEKIRGYNSIHESQTRMRTLGHIAREQLSRGLYEDTVKTAQLAIQTIEESKTEPEHLRPHLQHDQTVEASKLKALVARAQVSLGENSVIESPS